jgi:hypothetical protein
MKTAIDEKTDFSNFYLFLNSQTINIQKYKRLELVNHHIQMSNLKLQYQNARYQIIKCLVFKKCTLAN